MNHLPRFNKKKEANQKVKYFMISLLKLSWGTFAGFLTYFQKLSDQNMYTEYCFLSLASYVFFCYGTAAREKIINMLAGPFSI